MNNPDETKKDTVKYIKSVTYSKEYLDDRLLDLEKNQVLILKWLSVLLGLNIISIIGIGLLWGMLL